MRGTLGRRVRRGCFVAAGTCLLLALGSPSSPAQSDEAPPPEVFRGSASSMVASVQVDRAGLIPVPDLFKFIALDGVSTFESSFREARSSLLFPGNGLILGPSLACGTFGAQFPPDFKPILDFCLQYQYPLTVFADDFKPKGATPGSAGFGAPTDTISGNAISAKAQVAEDRTTTDAVMQDLRVLGVPPFGAVPLPMPGIEDTSLLMIDSATSRTNQRIVQGGLVTTAKATLSGVRMLGGFLQIESLVSTSRVTDDAQGTRTAVPSLVVSGVTVGGQPAQITNKGLVLGPSAADSPLDREAQSQINGALESMGVKVTILDSEQDLDDGGAAVANVGGLLIEFAIDVQGLPTTPKFQPDPRFPNTETDPHGLYVGTIQLGSTGALGLAVNYGSDFDPDFDVPLIDDGGFIDPGGNGFEVGGFDVAAPSFTDTPSSGGTGAVGATPNITGNRAQMARSIGGFFGNRLELLYLSLMFTVLACCISPRFAVPSRLPGRA